MNICIISPEFPPFTNWGGIATFNQNLAVLLAELKHNVYVVTLNPHLDKKYEWQIKNNSPEKLHILYSKFNFGDKILNFIYFKFPFGIFRFLLSKLFPFTLFSLEWNTFALLSFYKLQREIKVDVIHTPEYFLPALFIKLCFPRIPLIIHTHGPQTLFNRYEPKSFDRKLKAYLELFYMKHFPNQIIACSKNMKKYWEYQKISSPITVIPNFINLKDYVHSQQNLSSRNKSINIIFLGRLEYRKAPDILLKAFLRFAEKIPDVRLYFIGKDTKTFNHLGEYIHFKKYADKLIKNNQLKSRIKFSGHINSKEKLKDYLCKINKDRVGISVLPSRYEPFGYSIIEAMALGYIVIVSKNGGPKEIINDKKDGFLTECNLESLKKTLVEVINLSPEKKSQIIQAAYQKVKANYDSNIMCRKYSVLLKQIGS